MALLLSTTTISVLRAKPADAFADPYDEVDTTRDVVASGIRAHIGTPVGQEFNQGGGSQQVVTWRLNSDIADITHLDWICDEKTSQTYRVVWVSPRYGLGMDHMEGDLVLVMGVSGR